MFHYCIKSWIQKNITPYRDLLTSCLLTVTVSKIVESMFYKLTVKPHTCKRTPLQNTTHALTFKLFDFDSVSSCSALNLSHTLQQQWSDERLFYNDYRKGSCEGCQDRNSHDRNKRMRGKGRWEKRLDFISEIINKGNRQVELKGKFRDKTGKIGKSTKGNKRRRKRMV